MSDANIFLHSTLLTQTNLMYIVWTNYIIISFFLFVTGPEFYYVRKKCFCLLYTVYTDLWDIFFITTACNANRISAFFTCINRTEIVFSGKTSVLRNERQTSHDRLPVLQW